MQNVLILLVLVGLWAAVLVPDLIKRSSAARNRDTVGTFNRHMSSLQRTPPVTGGRQNRSPFQRSSSLPQLGQTRRRGEGQLGALPDDFVRMTKTQAQRRRQDVLSTLGAAALITFLGAISFGGAFTAINVVVDVAFALYVAALLSVTRRKKVQSEVAAYSYTNGGQYDNVAQLHSGPAMNAAPAQYSASSYEPERIAR